jgi:hypothetical protein
VVGQGYSRGNLDYFDRGLISRSIFVDDGSMIIDRVMSEL